MNKIWLHLDEPEEKNELFEHFRFVADPGQSLLRIDKFLIDRLQDTSRTKIKDAADAGCIFVNDKPVKANYKVKPGDQIVIMLSFPRKEFELVPEDIPIDVVYEDDSLLVVNKKPGMVVHPAHGNYSGTLVHALAHRYRALEMFTQEDIRAGLVHRIDKDTSGLLVVAKTEKAKSYLGKQFYNKTSHRIYQALVWGVPTEAEGTIDANIGRNPKNRQVMTVFPDGLLGKRAVTHYKVLEDFGYISLIECRLETGRTHQIRIHMKYIGHPLFNDADYGGNLILKGTTFTKYRQFIENCFKIMPRQALHAKELGFTHPETKVWMQFNSELPEDMTEVIRKWRTYLGGRTQDL
ncbi:MAG: RluA family pseudouridine synthase [Porphyromonadaceae bacterium]|nr:MAG: RluA family pseudouridine synthase [Porphyromonadaceae bacterium]